MDPDRKGAGLSRRQLSKSGAAAIAASVGTLTPPSDVASAQETHTRFANRTLVQIRINGAERTLELESRGLYRTRFAGDHSIRELADSLGISLRSRWPDRIDRDYVDALRQAIGQEKGLIAIDLTEVMLVDRETVRLFAMGELNGIELRNCPA